MCDESHYLNSLTSKRAKLVWGQLATRARRMWCLSGTPARNHAGELWRLLHVFGAVRMSYWDFVGEFLDTQDTVYGTKILGTKPSKLPEIKALLAPIMLRRTKEDVLPELPALSYDVCHVNPAAVDLKLWYPKVAMGIETEEELFHRLGEEIRAMSQLLAVAQRDMESAATALSGFQHATVLSRRYVGLQKVPSVVEQVKEELLEGHYAKIILFAWHRDVIELARLGLAEFNPVVLYGGQLMTKRDTHILQFQQKSNCRVMIAQIAAAGVAIDLTAATEVAFIEASYVPSDNAQAVMRAHRYGQKHPVRCRFFTILNSVDAQVTAILKRKTKDLTAIFTTVDGHTTQPDKE